MIMVIVKMAIVCNCGSDCEDGGGESFDADVIGDARGFLFCRP